MHHQLLILLSVCAWSFAYGEVVSNGLPAPTAVCSRARPCQLVPNAVAVKCLGGVCTPECTSGFQRAGAACVSVNITCGVGQQPHVNGTRCVVCPRNSYKDMRGNLPCTRCPNGTFTAGQRAQSHDNIDKCLAGGLTSSASGVLPPRLQQFRRHLAAAHRYMQGAQQPNQTLPCSEGCSATALSQLTEPVAYIAASPQVVAPQDRLLRLPARRPQIRNQGRCASCVNAAVASAAEAAIAAAAGTNTSGIALSSVYAYYCEPPMLRSCGSGWTFEDALEGMASATLRYLPDATCTEDYDLEGLRLVAPSRLSAACDAVFNRCTLSRLVSECSYRTLTDFWEVQHAIRVNGAVITRVSVGSSFVEFFQSNPAGVYNMTSNNSQASTIPHAVILIGYNNTGQYWWAQNSYGETFADQGIFKIAYGVALVGNPNETFAITCSLAPPCQPNPLKKWPLTIASSSRLETSPCYTYRAQAGDYLAGIADHFGADLLKLVANNTHILGTTSTKRPDVSTPLVGKRLLVCGVAKDLYRTANLDCGSGEYQSSSTGQCEVCPHDTYKTRKGPGPCLSCLQGTATSGCNASDHDNPSDCTPVARQQLCEQFIGRYNRSGVYNVTLRCKEYQVYCDMETDGGGWTMFLSYNVAANTFPRETYFRTLEDGFPVLSQNTVGVDESGSLGRGGSWGHMAPNALGQIPNFSEFLGFFETINPDNPAEVLRSHYKSADPRTLEYFKADYADGVPTDGVNLNSVRHTHTPMPDQNGFMPFDGEGKLVPTNLWSLALAGLPVRHAVYLRGTNLQPPECEPGWFQKAWSCHICPDHTYKDTHGPGPCLPCPTGKVAGASIGKQRSPAYHDSQSDCETPKPDVSWNISRPDGSLWFWDFFWSVRAHPGHAEEICSFQGGHLVTVESADTAARLADKVKGEDTGRPMFPVLHALDIMWIGLHSNTSTRSRTGPWTWYGGEAYSYGTKYTNWADSQPDNYANIQGQHAIFLLDNSNMWDDYYNFMYQEFVCERRDMS